MSIDLGELLSVQSSVVQAQKALRSWVQIARLNDKPMNIAFYRDGVYLTVQAVRIEFEDLHSTEAASDSGSGFARRGVLFGVKDNPTESDLDVKEWDTFVLDTEEYTIVQVNRTLIGQIQCQFEAV